MCVSCSIETWVVYVSRIPKISWNKLRVQHLMSSSRPLFVFWAPFYCLCDCRRHRDSCVTAVNVTLTLLMILVRADSVLLHEACCETQVNYCQCIPVPTLGYLSLWVRENSFLVTCDRPCTAYQLSRNWVVDLLIVWTKIDDMSDFVEVEHRYTCWRLRDGIDLFSISTESECTESLQWMHLNDFNVNHFVKLREKMKQSNA